MSSSSSHLPTIIIMFMLIQIQNDKDSQNNLEDGIENEEKDEEEEVKDEDNDDDDDKDENNMKVIVPRTWKYMKGISHGCWILTSSFLLHLLHLHQEHDDDHKSSKMKKRRKRPMNVKMKEEERSWRDVVVMDDLHVMEREYEVDGCVSENHPILSSTSTSTSSSLVCFFVWTPIFTS